VSADIPSADPPAGSTPPGSTPPGGDGQRDEAPGAARDDITESDEHILRLFEEHRSDQQIAGTGTVVRLLEDDDDGSRHQRFIVELGNGLTLLVAHNIDIAPRLDGLRVGDSVGFTGEYEYNDEGGVVHWTHHDPEGQHPPGQLSWDGQTFQ
jgi:hypothetical protein